MERDSDCKLLSRKDARKCVLEASDGRRFFAKNSLRKKTLGRDRPAWLVNEIVYWRFAVQASLRIPCARLLEYEGECYFGSEVVPSGRSVRNTSELIARFGGENRRQLVRALLLDLTLLNNDRRIWEFLTDTHNELWLVDHDQSLWGDGDHPSDAYPGDLGRIDYAILDHKFGHYIGDYLECPEANTLVWRQQNWPLIRSEMASLPLDTTVLRRAKEEDVPGSWLPPDLWDMMEDFLPRWWERLYTLFEREDALAQIVANLRQRGLFV